MMLNHRGQSLVLFIIVIPLIIGLVALIVDLGLMTSKKVKLNEVTREILKEVITKDNYEELIKKLYQENDIDIDNLEIVKNDYLRIKNEIDVDSIFGKIIGLKKYTIKVDLKASYQNGKIKIE